MYKVLEKYLPLVLCSTAVDEDDRIAILLRILPPLSFPPNTIVFDLLKRRH